MHSTAIATLPGRNARPRPQQGTIPRPAAFPLSRAQLRRIIDEVIG